MTDMMTIYQPSYDTTLKTGKEKTTERNVKSKQIKSKINTSNQNMYIYKMKVHSS